MEEDILEVGESIGVQCNNSFQVLSTGGVCGGSEGSGEGRVKGVRKVRVV